MIALPPRNLKPPKESRRETPWSETGQNGPYYIATRAECVLSVEVIGSGMSRHYNDSKCCMLQIHQRVIHSLGAKLLTFQSTFSVDTTDCHNRSQRLASLPEASCCAGGHEGEGIHT